MLHICINKHEYIMLCIHTNKHEYVMLHTCCALTDNMK